MYTIGFDPDRSVMHACVAGFWTAATMRGFAEEFARERARLRAAGTRFGVLGDAVDFAVQSRETAEALTRMVDAASSDGAVPLAIVAGSTLSKMQAERAMAAPHVRVFTDRADALDWLASAIASEPTP